MSTPLEKTLGYTYNDRHWLEICFGHLRQAVPQNCVDLKLDGETRLKSFLHVYWQEHHPAAPHYNQVCAYIFHRTFLAHLLRDRLGIESYIERYLDDIPNDDAMAATMLSLFQAIFQDSQDLAVLMAVLGNLMGPYVDYCVQNGVPDSYDAIFVIEAARFIANQEVDEE